MIDSERAAMLRLQAESNNRYLDTDPKALSRQAWVEASIARFKLTVAAWPDAERVEAWRSMMMACDAALQSSDPPPVDFDPYPDEPEPDILKFPENF